MKKQFNMNIIRNFTMIFVFIAAAYAFCGQFFLPKDTVTYYREIKTFNDGWYEVKQDGTREKLDVPGSHSGSIVMEAVLPDDLGRTGCCLEARGEQTKIYVDGELRASFDNRPQRAFSKECTETYVIAQLYPEDAGKTVRIELTSLSGVLFPVFIGGMFDLWMKDVGRYGSELVVAVLTIFLSMLAFLGCLFLRKKFPQTSSFIYLTIGICMGAFWIVDNSSLRDFYFNNIGTATDLCFLMVMLTPLPVLIYTNDLQRCRYQTAYFWVCLLVSLDFVCCSALHVIGIYDLHETFLVQAVCFALALALLVVTTLMDTCRKLVREYRFVAIGLLCVVLSALCQVIAYTVRNDAFSGIFLAIGLMLMLIFSAIHTVVEMLKVLDQKKEAELVSEAKGKFLANMSHEIRTPINAVLGMNEMILREAGEEDILKYAIDIKKAGESLLSLINDILDFSKIEAGKMELVEVEYNLAELLYATVIMSRPKIEAKGLELRVDVQNTLPKRLCGDDGKIRQILLNIMSNAIKYTEEGHVAFSVSGETVKDEVVLHFTITDTGIGMKQADLGRIFSEFERFDQNKNHMVEGTGLGMSITQRLLNMMESHLEIESTYGEGSSFSFSLCQKVVEDTAIGDYEEEGSKLIQTDAENRVILAPGTEVLVVDDKELNRKVFCALLKNSQMEIDQADGGMACLERLRKKKYDIIFLDHMMPDMDGIETLHRMKEERLLPPETKVVALTANAIKGAKEQYLQEGFDDYLSKPIIMDDLEEVLRKYLKSYEEISLAEFMKEEKERKKKGGASLKAQGDEDDIWQKLAGIPEIDLGSAKLYNPNAELMEDVLKGFYQGIGPDAEYLQGSFYEMQECFIRDMEDEGEALNESCKNYRVKVHSMKSSAKMIGAMKLSEEAYELELAAKEDKFDVIFEKTAGFLEHWKSFQEYLSFMAAPGKAEAEKLDAMKYKDVVFALFDLLNDAMQQMDIDKSDGLVLLLKQYRFPEAAAGDMDALEQAEAALDSDETVRLTAQLRQKLSA